MQFSNHTGYGSWGGEAFSGGHVRSVWRGIAALGKAAECEALLSGYLGSAEIGEAILGAVEEVKAANPQALYCCDPVLGDFETGLYVKPGIAEFMAERALPAADILTPNQFEAEILSGMGIASARDAREAVRRLQARGPRIVLVTSYAHGAAGGDEVGMLLADGPELFSVSTPRLPIDPPPSGTGDLSAALFLGHYLRTRDARAALELTTDSVYAVLERSLAEGSRELRLIQAQEALAHPKRRFPARDWTQED